MTPTRILLGAAGLGLMAYALVGIVTGPGTDPVRQALFMVALVLGHEGILIPVALAFGWAAVRFVPAWARPAAQAALVVTLTLTVVALPFIVNAGRFPDNPSLLPLDYRRGLLVAIAVTWLVAAAAAVTVSRWRDHRTSPRRRDPDGGNG
jgi:hypothetical protein